METTINGYDHQTLPLALEAVHILAEELPLTVILRELHHVYREAGDGLQELHRFYSDAGDEPSTKTNLDCQQICDTWLRSLDAALYRLEPTPGKAAAERGLREAPRRLRRTPAGASGNRRGIRQGAASPSRIPASRYR